jgi:hypothetical protein
MIYLWTAFDKTQRPIFSPVASLVFNSETNALAFYNLYTKGLTGVTTHLSCNETTERKVYLASLFDGPLVVNDFKAHIEAFRLPTNKNFKVYEIPEDQDSSYPKDLSALKKWIVQQLKVARVDSGARWQELLAETTVVYLDLERRGVLKDSMRVTPVYGTTFTGRSRSSGFSIHGAREGDDIKSTDNAQKVFIHADWIAADPRGWSLLCKDEAMQESFRLSDPYTYLAEKHGGTREVYKDELIKGIYSQNYSSEIYESFPQLKKWVEKSWEQIIVDGYSTSVMGRRFYGPRDVKPQDWTPHTKRSVFNAQMQGSTAHAMQNVMVELHRRVPHSLMTDLHDSVVLCTDKGSVKTIIDIVAEVMLHPFKSILPDNPAFPLRVSVGNQCLWKKWGKYKEYRE